MRSDGTPIHSTLELQQLLTGKDATLRTPPAQRPPTHIERAYYRRLVAILEATAQAVEDLVVSQLESLQNEYENDKPTPSVDRQDVDIGVKIAALFRAVRVSLAGQVAENQAEIIAQNVSAAIDEDNREEVSRVFRSVLGIDLALVGPNVIDDIQMWVSENVTLIQDVPNKFLRDAEGIINRGFRQGLRHEEIAKRILATRKIKGRQSAFKLSKNRAALIARDQVNKLNGQLTKLRQTNAGISRYRWRTVGDERVRPSHAEKEGRVYKWSKPPLDTGHPGEDINCRCYAEPVFEDILDDL